MMLPTRPPARYLAAITGREISTGTVKVFRFATRGTFISAPTDTPAEAVYSGVIEQAVNVRRSIFEPGTTEGRSRITFGDLVVANPDGALDDLLRYAFDGRSLVVLRGPATARSLTEFAPLFVGTCEQAEFSTQRITFKLRDRQAELVAPLQTVTFAGTYGVEGTTSDLAGKPKPLALGIVSNVLAPCCDAAKLIYQVSSDAVSLVDAVYDRGIPLTNGGSYATLDDLLNDALAPAPGFYKAYPPGGYFRLGASPAGEITADVTDGATPADRTAAALFARVLVRMGVDPSAIRSEDLTALDALNSAELGLWINDSARASDVLDQIANTVGAWWGTDNAGLFRIARIDRPRPPVVLSLSANDLIGPPQRLSTADKERGMPAYRVALRYSRNYRVQSDVAVASDARRAYLAAEWREAVAEDAGVQDVHQLAVALTYDSLFVYEDDARAEAARRLALRSVLRHRFDVVVSLADDTAALDLGDIVGLSHDRFGLLLVGDEDGQEFAVFDIDQDAKAERVRLTLWGSSLSDANLVTDLGAFLVTDDGAYLVTDNR